MPNRILKESIRFSDTLAKLASDEERLFFRLLTLADDYGRFLADVRLIRGGCYPLMLDRVTDDDVCHLLDALVREDLVRLYESNGKQYGYFVTWSDHQRMRNSVPKYPAPQGARQIAADGGGLRQVAADGGELRRVAASCGELRRVAAEVEVEVENEEQTQTLFGAAAPDLRVDYAEFDLFWTYYPLKANKAKARKAWGKLKPGPDLQAAMRAALVRQLTCEQWQRGVIPHASTWLNGKRWNDELGPKLHAAPAGRTFLK